nr:tRNA-modifying protein YgfZ [uncultured Tolumonas sp.]
MEKTMMNERLLFPSEPSVYHLDDVTVIRLEGPDAVKYLNGQVTCDVAALTPGQSSLGAHCNPKGKVLAAFRLFKREQDLLLMYKKELAEIELAELKKYAVFSKLTITDVSNEFHIIGVAGTGSDGWINTHITTFEQLDTSLVKCQIKQDRWLLLSQKSHPLPLSLPEQPHNDWWGLDILDGLPQLNKKSQAEFIPQALNLHALQAISFTKGCYTGQEIVARAKYRGINNRALFVLQGTASHPVTTDSVVERQLGEHWRSSGTILDVWQKDEQVLISIVLPSDTAPETAFRIENDEESSLSIHPLPYTLE